MQMRFLFGACTELLLFIMTVLLHSRPLLWVGSMYAKSKGIGGLNGRLHQLTDRKFSEHVVLSQVHKLELLFGTGIYAYENQT